VASSSSKHRALSLGQKGVLGISNSTDFFRSHSAGELRCEGRPLHSGRSAHVWEVHVTRAVDGKLVARGQVRFHVLDVLPAERSR
jgi:1,4-dihydroxy-2-naphthoyl-CoA hydrolase